MAPPFQGERIGKTTENRKGNIRTKDERKFYFPGEWGRENDRIYAHSQYWGIQIRTQIILPDPKFSPPNKPESGSGSDLDN
jgi:hypothetical protein